MEKYVDLMPPKQLRRAAEVGNGICAVLCSDPVAWPNVAVQALVQARSEAEREARVACNRVLARIG